VEKEVRNDDDVFNELLCVLRLVIVWIDVGGKERGRRR